MQTPEHISAALRQVTRSASDSSTKNSNALCARSTATEADTALVLSTTRGTRSAEALLAVYNPSTGAAAARCGEEMFVPGKRPTLAQAAAVYGSGTARDFMQIHIASVMRRNAMTMTDAPTDRLRADMNELAESMAEYCRHWMLSEIVVFFEKLSNGEYGELTRTLTRQQLFSRLKAFDAYRQDMRERAYGKMRRGDADRMDALMREMYPSYLEEAGDRYDLTELRRRAADAFRQRYGRVPCM